MPSIQVINRQRKRALSLGNLRQFAGLALVRVLAIAKCPVPDEVGVILVSDQRIAQLHQEYMAIAGPTDVITFQHGEVFVSVETAERQAREMGAAFMEEVRLYLVHGLLHLAGYDDRTPAGYQEMFKLQSEIVRSIELELG